MMWERIKAVIRSFFGFFIRQAEDPELMLRQYMDDVRAKVPKLRAAVADVMATEIQLQQQVDRLQQQIADLDKQIIAALKLGPEYEEEAKTLIAAKAMAEESLEDTTGQLETARHASQQARTALDDYQRDMERRIAEARQLIGQAKMAQMQEELASTMAAFEIGDPGDVLERMRDKVDERSARAQARVEVATSGVDSRLKEIRRASATIGVDEKLAEYKRQLGLAPAAEETGEKRMEAAAEQQERSVEL